ncbi:hypothetical protein [Patulibacter sp.]|uniref:hypothetical protein n=1 Tax=Patulibacter sp. TaxID=1912859 RepID=UPI00271A12B6|nr:hypothetical protein [Patulibacter sp.]MDO9409325.1 hypothetical protein [Patulibacter sp.]
MSSESEGVIDVASHSTMYAIGAYFCDRHPELVDDVLADADAIEGDGLRRWAHAEGIAVQDAFETLVTGLAIRFYTALAGESFEPDGFPAASAGGAAGD